MALKQNEAQVWVNAAMQSLGAGKDGAEAVSNANAVLDAFREHLEGPSVVNVSRQVDLSSLAVKR